MIKKGSLVTLKDTREQGRVVAITFKEVCTIILMDSNCCRIRTIDELEKV